MTLTTSRPDRRAFLAGCAALGAAVGLPAGALAQTRSGLMRTVPSTGEVIPAIGMGSWITFNVGGDQELRAQRAEVLRTLFDTGGAMVDSSPMYGSSEDVIGWCLKRLGNDEALFSATKVWTRFSLFGGSLFGNSGAEQMEDSRRLWGIDRFDLMQIHNLVDWEEHLKTLLDWKARGRVRMIGITASHGRRHDEFVRIMQTQPLDFVQFTYNVVDREAEKRLLPLAADKGLAVIVNRPFRQKQLFHTFGRQPLPEWAGEIDCANWAQFFLKFILSHPAVTCAIPATSRVDHMRENMGALHGRLPDAKMRERMVRYVESL